MPPRFPARAFSALQNPTATPVAPAPAAPARSFGTSPTAGSSRGPPTYPLQRCSRRPSNPKLRQAASGAGPSKTRGFHASAPSNASAKDPYEVLGVKKDAAAGDIKKAYYQLAKKWHPDSNKEKGANERFMEIQSAYDILSDDKKRQAYDRYGSASQQEGFDPDFARGAGGFGGFQDFGGFGGRAGNAGDLFEQLFGGAFRGGGGGPGGSPFGGGGQRQRNVRGDDLEATVTLSFLDAAQGVKRTLVTTPVVDCQPCTGSGLKPGEKKSQCTTCRGTGQQTFNVQGMYMASTCTACGGEGATIPRSARCGSCDGVGRIREKKTVEVEIPAGIDDGMKVKMPGMGDMPLQNSGPAGDLYVRVAVVPSKDFRRQGTNVYHDAKVPLHTALLGGRVRVATLEGDVEVRVREGTQHGEEAVLKGRGLKNVYGGRRAERGDLVVAWKIQIPRSLSPLQKQLLGAYAETTEGRTPEVHFGPLITPASSSSDSSPSGSTSASASESPSAPGRSSSPSPSRAQSQPAEAKAEARPKVVEAEYRRPQAESESEAGTKGEGKNEGGLLDGVASAVGGAIGWAERLFGGGGGKKRGPRKWVDAQADQPSETPTAKTTPEDEVRGTADEPAQGAQGEEDHVEPEEREEQEKKASTG